MTVFRPKLLAGFFVFVLIGFSVGDNEALALCATSGADPSTASGTAETVDTTACTVDGTATPSTITFNAGGTGLLTLDGVAPTGAITNTTDGQGSIAVNATVTSGADIGIATTSDLLALTVNNGATFNLGKNLADKTNTGNI